MLERLLLAAGLLAILVLLSLAARVAWTHYRRGLVRQLRRDGRVPAGTRILYFSTPYCVTCREMQEPTLERLATLTEQPIAVQKADPLERPDLARRYRVITVPTTAVFDDEGRLVEINYGYASLAQLAQQLGLELPEAATNRYEI